MKVIKASERLRAETLPPTGRFHGQVMQRPLHASDAQTRASFVHFEPGSHTHWHTHSGGQVLYIVQGRARVQAWEDDTMHDLAAGDTAISPPGEKHRHGAAADVAMTHLAVTCGEVSWLEDAED